jgi:diacylglycerol kinase (ATP)
MLKELFSKRKTFSFELKTNSIQKIYRAEMLVVANARTYGTGAVINPVGKTNDGKFEIVVIKPYPWWAFFKMIRLFFAGKPHKLEWVDVISAAEANIRFTIPQDLQVDGEVIEKIPAMQVEILAGAIKMRY